MLLACTGTSTNIRQKLDPSANQIADSHHTEFKTCLVLNDLHLLGIRILWDGCISSPH